MKLVRAKKIIIDINKLRSMICLCFIINKLIFQFKDSRDIEICYKINLVANFD